MATLASSLRLPTQIPWRRLAASRDMMDTSFDDRNFPLKWRTSLSIFYFQPEPDDEIYPDSRITYLKVVCSITGYQVEPDELGVQVNSPDEWDARVWRNFNSLMRNYYPCYGALLQVSVFPGGHDPDTPLRDYPYFVDFEPKKRELFEIVTESGEVLSRSLSSLRVGKNSTTAESMETVDVDQGWDFSAATESKAGGAGGGASIGLGSDVERGFRAGSRSDAVNFRTIDDSREKRESLSHTTQLSQMYQLLDSYHLGTNRALFAIFPRPHVVAVGLSGAPELRQLEGIQEFFLVVEQPRHVAGLCVEAQLETSHLHRAVRTEEQGATRYETGSIAQRIQDSSDSDTKRQYRIPVPSGYRVDRTRGSGGYDENVLGGDDVTEDIQSHSVRVFDDHILIEVTYDPDPVWPTSDTAFFTADYRVYYISQDPVETATTATVEEVTLYMTGRHLAGCLVVEDERPTWQPSDISVIRPGLMTDGYVTFEEKLPRTLWEVAAGGTSTPGAGVSTPATGVSAPGTGVSAPGTGISVGLARQSNELGKYIKGRVLASVNSPDRYSLGRHNFLQTDFATRALARSNAQPGFAPSVLTRKVMISDSLADQLSPEVRENMASKSVASLLMVSTADIERALDVPKSDILALKLANLGVPLIQPGGKSAEGGDRKKTA